MKKTRNRIKQSTSLVDRLHQLAQAAMIMASNLPQGVERERLLKKAREAERAIQIDQLLSTPGLELPE